MGDLFMLSGVVMLIAWVLLLIGVWNVTFRLRWHARVRGEWDNRILAELKGLRTDLAKTRAAPAPPGRLDSR